MHKKKKKKRKEKTAEKHLIEKPILLNFVNLPTTFCPQFSFITLFRPLDFTFSEDFSISQDLFALQIVI